jgi:hypothetical protein
MSTEILDADNTQQSKNEQILAEKNLLPQPSYQPYKKKSFSFPVLVYLYGLSKIVGLFLACLLVHFVFPHMYVFDVEGSYRPTLPEDSFFNILEGITFSLLFIIALYYVFGKNKPYWINLNNISNKFSTKLFFFPLFIVYTLALAPVFALLSPINQNIKLDEGVYSSYKTFKNTFDAFTHVYDYNQYKENQKLVRYDYASEQCQNANKAVDDYIKSPILTPVDEVLKSSFVIANAELGCLKPSEAFNKLDSLSKRASVLKNPAYTIFGWIIPGYNNAQKTLIQSEKVNQRIWCEVLSANDSDISDVEKSKNVKMCVELNTDIDFKTMPTESTVEDFYNHYKKK